MQNYNNSNQSQPNNANSYYHDPLEDSSDIDVKPAENDRQAMSAPESTNDELQARAADNDAAGAEAPAESNPELEAYLESTKKLLVTTRKERNNLIIRIDEEEDNINIARSKHRTGASEEYVDYDKLNELRKSLFQKNELIDALVSVLGTIG